MQPWPDDASSGLGNANFLPWSLRPCQSRPVRYGLTDAWAPKLNAIGYGECRSDHVCPRFLIPPVLARKRGPSRPWRPACRFGVDYGSGLGRKALVCGFDPSGPRLQCQARQSGDMGSCAQKLRDLA